jgi:hypothetical protein
MPNDLEQRLERALDEPFEPSEEVTRRARDAALATLPDAPPSGRGTRLALAAGLVAAALSLTGVALAASGSVRHLVGIDRDRPHPRLGTTQPAPLVLPHGALGFSVTAQGRMWLANPGRHLLGVRITTSELSPAAINLVLAHPRHASVVTLATGHTAWTLPSTVVAASWSPDGLRVAYVAQAHGHYVLHVIEGDGDHDQVVDRSVSAVTPSWRADGLGLAYVGANGQVVVRDLVHDRASAVQQPHDCPFGRADGVAFAPRGSELAATFTSGEGMLVDGGHASCFNTSPVFARTPLPSPTAGIGWLTDRELVVGQNQYLSRVVVGSGGAPRIVGYAIAPGGLVGLTVSPDRRHVALAMWEDDGVHVVSAAPPPTNGHTKLKVEERLLLVAGGGPGVRLQWR